VSVVDVEIYGAASVGEVFWDAGQMEDLVVAGVLAEIGAAHDAIADFEVDQGLWDFQTAADEGSKDFVGELRCIEAEDDQVVVLDVFALEAPFHPVAEALEFIGSSRRALLTIASAGVHGYGREVENYRREKSTGREHARRIPR
jgi:hypothetical protein